MLTVKKDTMLQMKMRLCTCFLMPYLFFKKNFCMPKYSTSFPMTNFIPSVHSAIPKTPCRIFAEALYIIAQLFKLRYRRNLPSDQAITSFQAFCVSTASRVGVGNIAGVAIAIVTGGPGAVFWMWVIAFIGCATGFVEKSFGVYVDTWIVCSATAFIVLLTGQYEIGGQLTGIALAQQSLASIFGSLAPSALSLMILMFAFSSIVGNYYYGEINIAFFEGKGQKILQLFRCGVILMVLFGCLAEFSLVWNLADLFMGLLCLTNLYAIVRLAKYVRITLNNYVEQKQQGISEPSFDPAILESRDGIHAWGIKHPVNHH